METDLAAAAGRNPLESAAHRLRRGSPDAVMLYLVRVILEETWSAEVAADRLVELVDGDMRALRRAHARVLRAAQQRTSPPTERALRTLELALGPGPGEP